MLIEWHAPSTEEKIERLWMSNMSDMLETARETLAIIMAAKPVQDDIMFPDYHDAPELCRKMLESLSKWPDPTRVDKAVQAFRRKDTANGMKFARENVHFYLPKECGWSYIDD